MKLYRTVSDDEWENYSRYKEFKTAKNTLEEKQFFKSDIGVREYKRKADQREFSPPYNHLLIVDIDAECLADIPTEEETLDDYEAITVFEANSTNFNNCDNFVERHDI